MKISTFIFRIKQRIATLFECVNKKYSEHFSTIQEISYGKIGDYLYSPKDSSSLAITRILFGVCMLFDIPEERGGAVMTSRWGNPDVCHFPLIPFVRALPMPYMALVYLALWLGALGITLGYRYLLSTWTFIICYWYLFLIEKSFWNNHSYLFGLIALLIACTDAGCFWSMDSYLDPSLKKTMVPYWNYFILKYQFFILYFMAGLKKGTAEWLTGYSVQNLSEHWVFSPFKLFLTVPQIDYLIVHWFIFVFDLTIAFWMMHSKTRHAAMFFCATFHLMNIRLFRIGMFPWVCLSTMPLFYPFDWPKKVSQILSKCLQKYYNNVILKITRNICIKTQTKTVEIKDSNDETKDDAEPEALNEDSQDDDEYENHEVIQKIVEPKSRKTFLLIYVYVFLQAFLPYSHFITKGYNNWTDGLYGYSWDMMVHSWDVNSVIIKIVDSESEFYLDPHVFTPNDRWTRHGDMIYQYAQCIKEKIGRNVSIYFDIWCSLNGRFTQRMFNSKIDVLNVSWSPFHDVLYLMPLIEEGYHWRSKLQNIKEDINARGNGDVIFIAEFPGYEQHKFIPTELDNTSLTVLEGSILYGIEDAKPINLFSGMRVNITPNKFHKVKNIGTTPAFYMYTFTNSSKTIENTSKPYLPIVSEIAYRIHSFITFAKSIMSSMVELKQCH